MVQCGTAYKVVWDALYTGAFIAEMQAFADMIVNDKETPVTGGPVSVLMAAAARQVPTRGRPVKISEIE